MCNWPSTGYPCTNLKRKQMGPGLKERLDDSTKMRLGRTQKRRLDVIASTQKSIAKYVCLFLSPLTHYPTMGFRLLSFGMPTRFFGYNNPSPWWGYEVERA